LQSLDPHAQEFPHGAAGSERVGDHCAAAELGRSPKLAVNLCDEKVSERSAHAVELCEALDRARVRPRRPPYRDALLRAHRRSFVWWCLEL
jgi:hypothetical protein